MCYNSAVSDMFYNINDFSLFLVWITLRNELDVEVNRLNFILTK